MIGIQANRPLSFKKTAVRWEHSEKELGPSALSLSSQEHRQSGDRRTKSTFWRHRPHCDHKRNLPAARPKRRRRRKGERSFDRQKWLSTDVGSREKAEHRWKQKLRNPVEHLQRIDSGRSKVSGHKRSVQHLHTGGQRYESKYRRYSEMNAH